jgi:hypothetical protein
MSLSNDKIRNLLGTQIPNVSSMITQELEANN